MEFLAEYKSRLANSKFNFLTPQENDGVAQLLTRQVIPVTETSPIATLVGPKTVSLFFQFLLNFRTGHILVQRLIIILSGSRKGTRNYSVIC